MARSLNILLIITFSLFLFGCYPDKLNLPDNSFRVESKVKGIDDKNIYAEIKAINETGYEYKVEGVFGRLISEKRKINMVETHPSPLLIEAEIVPNSEKNQFVYKITIPKQVIKSIPGIKKDLINIEIRGYFDKRTKEGMPYYTFGDYLELDDIDLVGK